MKKARILRAFSTEWNRMASGLKIGEYSAQSGPMFAESHGLTWQVGLRNRISSITSLRTSCRPCRPWLHRRSRWLRRSCRLWLRLRSSFRWHSRRRRSCRCSGRQSWPPRPPPWKGTQRIEQTFAYKAPVLCALIKEKSPRRHDRSGECLFSILEISVGLMGRQAISSRKSTRKLRIGLSPMRRFPSASPGLAPDIVPPRRPGSSRPMSRPDNSSAHTDLADHREWRSDNGDLFP